MMKKRKIVSMFASGLMSAMVLTACGKINLPTLLVMDPAAKNTLTISLPESLGGGEVVSNLVGNVDTTVVVDTAKLISLQGVPATVTVNAFEAAGSSIMLGSIASGTLCTYIPEGEEAGGVAYLRPLIFKDATFKLTIPTETKSVSKIVQALMPPIALALNIDARVRMDLIGLINLMLKGTGLNIHQALNLTIPADIPLLGGSAVVLDTTLKSTKTKITDPLLDECQIAANCGNGVLDSRETCDTAIAASQTGACPTSCTAPDTCTTSTLQNAGTCTAACTKVAITPCCGNGVVEPGEDCDPPAPVADYCSNDCRFDCSSFLAGTWITRLTTTGSITAPSPVGTLTGSNIDVVQRMVIRDDCSNHVVVGQLEICSLSTTASSTIPFRVDYSEAVLASMTATGSAPFSMYAVGDTVALPNFTIMTGWDPSCTPVPVLPDPYCLCFPDSDHDGICGITLPMHLFNGALNLNTYAGLTMNISYSNMVLTDPGIIAGTTAFPTTGYIWGSTGGPTGVLNIAPSSNGLPVTMIKLAGDVDCATVLTHCTGAECVP